MRGLTGVMVATLMVAGCALWSKPPVRACTKVGCSSGLAVEVTNSLQQAVTVNVRSGNQIIHTFRCEPGQPCRSFIENQTPERVVVSVQYSGGPVSKEFTPVYQMNRPNGPDCPPDCRQATVTLTVT